MSFHGAHYPGAMKDRRKQKRAEAELRNAATKPENRKRYRLAAAAAADGEVAEVSA